MKYREDNTDHFTARGRMKLIFKSHLFHILLIGNMILPFVFPGSHLAQAGVTAFPHIKRSLNFDRHVIKVKEVPVQFQGVTGSNRNGWVLAVSLFLCVLIIPIIKKNKGMNRKKSRLSREHLDYPDTGKVVPKETKNTFETDSEEKITGHINSSIQDTIQRSIKTLATDLKTEFNFILQENSKQLQGLIENQMSLYQKKIDESVYNTNHLLDRCLENIHSLLLQTEHFTQHVEKMAFKTPDHLSEHTTVTRFLQILLDHDNRVGQRNEILEKIAREYFSTDMGREVSDAIMGLTENLAFLYGSVSKIRDDFKREGKEVPVSVQITTEKMRDVMNECEQYMQWHRNRRLNMNISISLREDDGIYPLEDIASALGDVVMKLKTPEKYFTEKFDTVIKNLIELINFLDEIAYSQETTIELGELIHKCEKVHLREVYPNEKETFSPALHEVEGIDVGPRDQILKVKQRGFTYKGNLVQKPRVIIGGKTRVDHSVK